MSYCGTLIGHNGTIWGNCTDTCHLHVFLRIVLPNEWHNWHLYSLFVHFFCCPNWYEKVEKVSHNNAFHCCMNAWATWPLAINLMAFQLAQFTNRVWHLCSCNWQESSPKLLLFLVFWLWCWPLVNFDIIWLFIYEQTLFYSTLVL